VAAAGVTARAIVFAIAFCLVDRTHAATLAEPPAYAAELASLVNQYRAGENIAALKIDARLGELAREHSAAMKRANRMSHDGFQARFRRTGYAMCVENVGWNYPTPAEQMKAWRASPGHDRNLRDARVTHAGVGVAGAYVTFLACR
jgi:uncharacterized protein YkwD